MFIFVHWYSHLCRRPMYNPMSSSSPETKKHQERCRHMGGFQISASPSIIVCCTRKHCYSAAKTRKCRRMGGGGTIYVHIYIYTCIHLHLHVHIDIYIYTCMCIYTCTHMYMLFGFRVSDIQGLEGPATVFLESSLWTTTSNN